MERYVVVDNVCGWPKLTLLADGSINLEVHNQASHGSNRSGSDCYKSTDGGRNFKFYSKTIEGEAEKHSFVDKACGEAHNGDYMVIVQDSLGKTTDILRSCDGGKSFKKTGEIKSGRVQQSNHGAMPFPYGIIQKIAKNTLVFHYFMNTEDDWNKGYSDAVHESHIRISRDDGMTWEEDYIIDTGINETAVWFYDENEGIAVGRIDSAFIANEGKQRDQGGGNKIYRTLDGGKTWTFEGNVLGQGMIPTHLIELVSGETLMTFGFRFANKCGIMACISKDRGKTWGVAEVLAEYPGVDSGYPSTIQIEDGTLVTAYYCQGHMYHTRYHVGIIKWKISDMTEGRWVEDPLGRPAKFFVGTNTEHVLDWRIN